MHDNNRAVDANPPQPSMLANLMTPAAAYAVRQGLPLDRIAEAAGIEAHALIAAPERVPEEAVSRILDLLQETFPDEAVALDLAAAAPLSFLGPFEAVARRVPDLRTGIEMFVRYRSVLSTSFSLEFTEEPPGPMLRFEHPNDARFGALGAEMGLAMGARAIIEGCGLPYALRQVWFSHTPTAPATRYDEGFPVPVRFDAPAHALLFHSHRLGDPVDPAAGARLRVLRANLELVRQELEQHDDPIELQHIRDAAANNAALGDHGAAALANRLGLSQRTLQRRVADLDTSVSAIIDEVRSATARQLLTDPELSLFEIALALGYSSDSAFRRAFRRWTGQTPAQYRRALGDQPSA